MFMKLCKLMFSTDLSCLYLASCTDCYGLLLCCWLATLMLFYNAAHDESHTLGSECLSEDNRSQWGFKNMNTIERSLAWSAKWILGFSEQKDSVALQDTGLCMHYVAKCIFPLWLLYLDVYMCHWIHYLACCGSQHNNHCFHIMDFCFSASPVSAPVTYCVHLFCVSLLNSLYIYIYVYYF